MKHARSFVLFALGAWLLCAAFAPEARAQRSPAKLYAASCATCHATVVNGTPAIASVATT